MRSNQMGNTKTRKTAASIRQKQILKKRPDIVQHGKEPPKLIADVMLGRLAKWLRIAGFDVLYSNTYSDDELVEISNREERVLLSRDTRLLIRKSVTRFIFLESQEIHAQIIQVLEAMQISALPLPLTRCLACNEALIDAEKESVRRSVPAYVYATQSRFRSCPKCGGVFWAGTHRKSVMKTLDMLLARISGQNSRKPGLNPVK
jgi:uncharacterized protein with PIN domain